MTTQQGYNMDCLKILHLENKLSIGVFHSSKGFNDSYNRLYFTIYDNQTEKWKIYSKLSDRGSQGTLFEFKNQHNQFNFLVAYELQNHQNGNKFALRFYQDLSHLISNNFLYEYQLGQIIDSNKVRNIGTPSIDYIKLVKSQPQIKFNSYTLAVKFHFSPDGSHDLPGYGIINLNPLRDFVDKNGKWIGGCKQNYSDWKGNSDINVRNAFLNLGVTGKIGQKDSFQLERNGNLIRYYIYEANLYNDFNWKNWRIFLYRQSQAYPIPFIFDKVIDIANPHISLISVNNSIITFQLSFFLPSEGMQPLSDAKPGQMIIKSKINITKLFNDNKN